MGLKNAGPEVGLNACRWRLSRAVPGDLQVSQLHLQPKTH